MEIYVKVNCEFENYLISNLTNVKNEITGKILKPQLDKYGYNYVTFTKNGKSKKFKLHRLMAMTFIENIENKKEVNHINGIKTDNRIENLEWVTHFENQMHKTLMMKKSSKYIGVCFYKQTKKWKSQIQINNKKISLGYFNSEIEAYNARVNFEAKHNIVNKYIL